uniref:BAG domain-containing protein n=1 Tax=Anopheles maculatus TaxID=74869 RepID=A0A182ST96_9DIPT
MGENVTSEIKEAITMSSQQEQPQQQQPTVRHIPIFVEGRSEPLINTAPESRPSQPSQHHPSAAGMDGPSMDMPDRDEFFKHGTIFDRARDIPDDPITKIQKIQKDVLAIFDQVEHFKGGKEGKKDKAYIYLDEMLTQNLLKLDSIDAEDQPQIKSARKEAIKSINTCIAVLEAKAEAGASGSTNASTGSIGSSNANSNGIDATNGTQQSASNTSIPHSSSNSSQQQPNEVSKQ